MPLDLRFVNIIQTVSFLNSADTNGKLSDDMMRVFYEEERIPEVVLNNQHTRTLIGLLGYAFKLIYFVVVGS